MTRSRQYRNQFGHIHGAAATEADNAVHVLLAGVVGSRQHDRFGRIGLHIAVATHGDAGPLQQFADAVDNAGGRQPRVGDQQQVFEAQFAAQCRQLFAGPRGKDHASTGFKLKIHGEPPLFRPASVAE